MLPIRMIKIKAVKKKIDLNMLYLLKAYFIYLRKITSQVSVNHRGKSEINGRIT